MNYIFQWILFQFTFPRGERLFFNDQACTVFNFNSRSHVGNDQNLQESLLPQTISIHVPTWGTTRKGEEIEIDDELFQFTFPRGERPQATCNIQIAYVFQFTFPRGERRKNSRRRQSRKKYFNSRSHVGNDLTGIP